MSKEHKKKDNTTTSATDNSDVLPSNDKKDNY